MARKWCSRQGSHLRPPPSQGGALSAELREQRLWSHRRDLRPAVVLTKDVHRFLCFGGSEKLVRHAGDAPASPRWQRGVLLMDEYRKKKLVRREGFAPSRAGCRPAMLLLHHHRLRLAAGVGIAPTSRAFQTRAHLSMPSSVLIGAHTRYRASVFPLSTDCSALELCGQKWCVRRELHPRCSPLGNGFTGRCDTSDSRLTRIEIVGHARELSLAARSRLPCGCSFKHIGCIRSPACADHSLAREVCSNEIGPCGRICTRTVPFLRRTPLLGWATQG